MNWPRERLVALYGRPDLPGCVSTGTSVDEVTEHIQEAIALHIESLREHGEEVPPPTSRASTVQVA